MERLNLSIQCGSKLVSYETVMDCRSAVRLGPRHYPMPHGRFVQAVEDQMLHHGLKTVQSAFALQDTTRNGEEIKAARLFGLIQVANDSEKFGTVIALRNSVDQSLGMSIGYGHAPFVCDNLVFAAEVLLARKNMITAFLSLSSLVRGAFDFLLSDKFESPESQMGRYCATLISNRMADHIILTAARNNVIQWPAVKNVVEHYLNPPQEEIDNCDGHYRGTLWGAYSALSRYMRPSNRSTSAPMFDLGDRSRTLNTICEHVVRGTTVQ